MTRVVESVLFSVSVQYELRQTTIYKPFLSISASASVNSP